jgi:hypothetical protein
MSDQCDENIERAVRLARELMELADDGQTNSLDTGCSILYGIIRDCGFRIRAAAEQERELHGSRRPA